MAPRSHMPGGGLSYQYSSLPEPGDPDGSVKQSPVAGHRRSRRLRFCAVLPALVVAVAAAGMATGLIAYLFTRRITPNSLDDDTIFRGAVIVDEPSFFNTPSMVMVGEVVGSSQSSNNATDGASGSTTLFGLVISSLSKDLVSWSAPYVIAVYGFILANMWIKNQHGHAADYLPTPAQYGLLVSLLNGSAIKNVYDMFSYLARDRRSRPNSPRLLHSAVYFVSLVLLVGFGFTIADLWFHTVTEVVVYTSVTPTPAPAVGSRVDLSVCPGPIREHDGLYRNCQINWAQMGNSSALVWGNDLIRAEGSAVVAGSSSKSRVSFVDDDLSVLLPAMLPSNIYQLNLSTVAMRTSCGGMTTCNVNPSSSNPYINCSSFSPLYSNAWPIYEDDYTYRASGSLAASVDLQQYDVTSNNLVSYDNDPDNSTQPVPGAYALGSSLSPAGILLFFSWLQSGVHASGISFPALGSHSDPGWYSSPGNVSDLSELGVPDTVYYYVGTCNVSVYNVNLTYSTTTHNYSLDGKPIEADWNTSSALLGALDLDYNSVLGEYMLSALQPSLAAPSDVFQRSVASNVSFAALGLVSDIMQRTPALGASTAKDITVTRYPVAALYTVLVLLYLYAVICFATFIAAMSLSSPEIVLDAGTRTNHTLLDVAQLRLTDPRAVVADAFDKRTASEILADKPLSELYEEHHETSARLGVGFVYDSAEAEDAKRPVLRLRLSTADKLTHI